MSGPAAKKAFNETLFQWNKVNHLRSWFMDNERYNRILQEVKDAQNLQRLNKSLTSKHYRRLRRYDILQVGGEEKLVENFGRCVQGVAVGGRLNTRLYCKVEELWDVLREAHRSTGHKKTRKMELELRKKYCNITRQVIDLYVVHCVQCQQKKSLPRRKLVMHTSERKPLKHESVGQTLKLEDYVHCRGYVELIDMEFEPDGDFRFILNYQDHMTKFTVLRPLKSESASVIARQLMDIFCLFGAPFILQSISMGREFVYVITTILSKVWPRMKVVHGKSYRLPDGACKHDVQALLHAWMSAYKVNSRKPIGWSEALRFVQSEINCSLHSELQRSPNEAMFGAAPRYGLQDSPHFSADILADLNSEEELRNLCNEEIKKLQNNQDDEQFNEEVQKYFHEKLQSKKLPTAALALPIEEQTSEEEEDDDDEEAFSQFLLPIKLESPKMSTENTNNKTNQHIVREEAEESASDVATNDAMLPLLHIGTNVLIKQPDGWMDGSMEHTEDVAVIVSVKPGGLYELATILGVTLERLYARDELTLTDNEYQPSDVSPSLSFLMAESFW